MTLDQSHPVDIVDRHKAAPRESCDRCPQSPVAQWVSTSSAMSLKLCGHHDREYQGALLSQGFERG